MAGMIPPTPQINAPTDIWGMKYWIDRAQKWIRGTSEVKPLTITANYAIQNDESFYGYIVDTTGGSVVLTLPPANGSVGKKFFVKMKVTNAIAVVNPYSGDTIDGAASVILTTANDWVEIVSDGVNKWWIVSKTSSGGSGGSGTVTSVGLTVPGEFSVSGSPVTTSGTLAISKATQSANTVWAGPISGSAAQPTFRALNVADFGGLGLALISKQVASGSSATITFSSIPQTFSDLIITFHGRVTSTSVADNSLFLRMNGDTNNANYSVTCYYGNFGLSTASAGTVNPTTNGGNFMFAPGTNVQAAAVASSEGFILQYSNASFGHSAFSNGFEFYSGLYAASRGFRYSPAAAITQLELITPNGNFTSGSVACLYGRG